jgi:phage shock protein PspC (stress-responsive transcriptional regulator)
MNTASEHAAGSTANGAPRQADARPWCRPADNRMIAGVAAGVARALGVDPVVVRIGFVVLTLLGAFGIVLYLAGWALIPDERSGRALAADLLEAVGPHQS